MAAKETPTFYIFHGEDDFTLKAEVRAFRAKMGDLGELNTSEYNETTPVRDILAAVNNMPFMADKRLVIVWGLLSVLGATKKASKSAKADLEQLLDGLSILPDYARLMFVEMGAVKDDHPVLKLARTHPRGYEKAFNAPKDVPRWILRQVENYGGRIDPFAAQALAQVVGTDLHAADAECFKLVNYVGGTRAISADDVSVMTSYVPETRVWDIVDALGRRETKKALEMIHNLLADPKQDPFMLFGTINRQFRLLIMVRETLDTGGSLKDLKDVPSFKTGEYSRQANNFTMEQLEGIYRNLLETDNAIKTGRVGGELALDLFVAGLGGA
jgi:DNA polymerase III subunit delta